MSSSLSYIHGQNLDAKIRATGDADLLRLLSEYERFRAAIARLDPSDRPSVDALVDAFNVYREEAVPVLEARRNSGQENLRSTLLEEFFQHLFLPEVGRLLGKPVPPALRLGKENACFVDISFAPRSFNDMFVDPGPYIHTKDQDFVVGANIAVEVSIDGVAKSSFEAARAWSRIKPQRRDAAAARRLAATYNVAETEVARWKDGEYFSSILRQLVSAKRNKSFVTVPVVAIECKTYIERNMLDACSGTARRLKAATPYCQYFVAAEYMKIDEAHPELSAIDDVLILCKASVQDRLARRARGEKPHPICGDVVYRLFVSVVNHLQRVWWSPENALERGFVIGRPL